VRGRGLLLGVELERPERAGRVARDLLLEGWIVGREGDDGRTLVLTPPLDVPEALLERGIEALADRLAR
jgi:4-aminobutyrate aminotransferase-like enzyme